MCIAPIVYIGSFPVTCSVTQVIGSPCPAVAAVMPEISAVTVPPAESVRVNVSLLRDRLALVVFVSVSVLMPEMSAVTVPLAESVKVRVPLLRASAVGRIRVGVCIDARNVGRHCAASRVGQRQSPATQDQSVGVFVSVSLMPEMSAVTVPLAESVKVRVPLLKPMRCRIVSVSVLMPEMSAVTVPLAESVKVRVPLLKHQRGRIRVVSVLMPEMSAVTVPLAESVKVRVPTAQRQTSVGRIRVGVCIDARDVGRHCALAESVRLESLLSTKLLFVGTITLKLNRAPA